MEAKDLLGLPVNVDGQVCKIIGVPKNACEVDMGGALGYFPGDITRHSACFQQSLSGKLEIESCYESRMIFLPHLPPWSKLRKACWWLSGTNVTRAYQEHKQKEGDDE